MDDNITKRCSKSLVIPTGKTTDYTYGLEILSETILLLKVDCFKGILNWMKIDEW